MQERCDRCGGRAHTIWTKGKGTLTFCPQCNDKHELALISAGFKPEVIEDEVLAEVKQS